jgi:tetratricopeptide (TPR) repeat protein
LGYEWDFPLAEKYFKRALELNPNYAEGHVWYGHYLSSRGEHDLAVKEMRRAERLNPQATSLLAAFALCLRNARRFEEGAEKLRRALILQPNYPTALQGFNWFVPYLKNYEEAENSCRLAVELTGRQNLPLYAYGYTLAIVGKKDEARKIIEELKERRQKQYVPPIYFVLIHTGLGETEEALGWLEQCAAERDFWMVWVPVDPRFDSLRDDVRYSDAIKKIVPIDAIDDIHQSHIATKILPAAQAEAPKPVEEKAEEKVKETIRGDSIEIPAKPRRRVWAYAALGLLIPVLLIVAVFVGMRLGWGFAVKIGKENALTAQQKVLGNAKTLAIFPFAPGEAGEREESLSVSLAQVFTDKLGQIRRLSVVPATVTDSRENIRNVILETGKELGANYILHGSIQQQADKIHIKAVLFTVSDGKIAWEEKFEESLADLPKLQISIPEKVLQTLSIEPSEDERRQIEKIYTTNGEAYQLYLNGRYQMTARTSESMRRAIQTFNDSRDKDPNFALAYAGLADAYALLNLYEIPPPADAYEKAKENALKALTIDSTLAETHASLAYVLFNHEGNFVAAETNYRRAIELNPSYPRSFHWFALMLSATGKHEEAIEKIKKAQQLAPHSAIVHAAAALVYYYAQNFHEAKNACHKSLEINNKFVPAYKNLRVIYEATGDYEKALEAYKNERLYSNDTDEANPNWMMIRAQVEAVGGKRAEALKSLSRAIAEPDVKNNPMAYSYEIAAAYALLGEKKEALRWLEIAKNSRANNVNFFEVDSRFERIRY